MKSIDLTPLVELGFTNLEAEIYAYLLENSPSTGYGIAKGIGKPAANIYKAVESLHKKSAIIIDDSETRLCRAVPVDELFAIFERKFKQSSIRAKGELAKLRRSPDDNRIYQLQTTDQVISRFKKMLDKCKRVAILDFFPYAVDQLRDDIIRASKRGVKIRLHIYQPVSIPGINIFIGDDGPEVVKKWPGQWANGMIDGEEYLQAFLSKDGSQVIQAIWSNNQYLSWIYYDGFIHELAFSEIANEIDHSADFSRIKRIVEKYKKLSTLKSAGYDRIEQFVGNNKGKAKK